MIYRLLLIALVIMLTMNFNPSSAMWGDHELTEATDIDLLRARITLQKRHVDELECVARRNPIFQDLYAAERAAYDQLTAALKIVTASPQDSGTKALIETYKHFDEDISQGSPLTRTTSLNIGVQPPETPHFLKNMLLRCGKCFRIKAKQQ